MQIYFILTEKCNLNCSMCIRGRQKGPDMDLKVLNKIINDNDFSEHDIVITGGEPTIHSNYTDIVRMMSDCSKTVTVTSNGTLNMRYEELSDIKNLYFQISVDGYGNTHNIIRGNGTFERTWENIKKMDAMGINYSIASVVSKNNENEILKLLPILESLKNIRFWRISYEMPFGSAKGVEKIMTAEEWNQFVDRLLYNAKLRVKVQKIFPFELYDKNLAKIVDDKDRKSRSLNCGSGANKLYVYPKFDVYPCTCLTDFCVGNLSKQNLEDILTSESIKIFSEYELDKESNCQNCEYKSFCNGGCIGMSYHYFGKLGMGDLRCPKIKL